MYIYAIFSTPPTTPPTAFRLKNDKIKNTVIRLEVYIPGETSRFKYNTERNINPKNWDKKKCFPRVMQGKEGDRNRDLTLALREYEYQVQQIKDLYGKSLTASILKKQLNEYFHVEEEALADLSVDYYFKLYVEELKNVGEIESSSIKSYTRVFDKFKKFEKGKEILLTDLDNDTLTEFIVFLRSKYNLNDNTLYRNFGFYKFFLNWCIKKGVNVPLAFKDIKISPFETDDIALTESDLDTLAGLELDERLEQYKDLFLIGCYSGQRYSDYSVFEKSDVQGDMIIKRVEKTETHSFIPLHPKLKSLLDKYDWNLNSISTQKFNKNIQKICKMAGFTEEIKNTVYYGAKKEVVLKQRWQMVGSHTARRTFITIVAEKSMPDHIIMSITGIRDPKTLNKYKKINKESITASAFKIFS